MRTSILLLVALLVFGCSSKKADENDTGSTKKIGVIVAREDVETMDVEEETRTNTSAYGGVSSGGFAIGSGVLFSPRTSGASARKPMRYEVELQNEGRITVYHDSYDFQIGDCVEIGLYPDEEEHLPTMKRIKGGC